MTAKEIVSKAFGFGYDDALSKYYWHITFGRYFGSKLSDVYHSLLDIKNKLDSVLA